MIYYGHSIAGRPVAEWEPLERHLADTSRLASEFAAIFAAGDWGGVAGLWHDVGKYSTAFQAHVREQNGLGTEDDAKNNSTAAPYWCRSTAHLDFRRNSVRECFNPRLPRETNTNDINHLGVFKGGYEHKLKFFILLLNL